MLRRIILLFVLFSSIQIFGQCFKENNTFSIGEDLKYTVSYNWGFIWLDAGLAEFAVKPAKYINRDVYYFDASGSSYKSYDWLYKVRDHYQAYLDKKTLLPLWFQRENYEGGYQVDNQYIFDWRNSRIFSYTQNSNRAFRKDTVTVNNHCTFDLLSLIYYSRNLNFDNLNINDTIPVKTIIDGELYNLHLRYLGRETIKNRKNEQYKCIKFSALLVEGTIFKEGEDLFVWVTDDENRVPVLIEAKILVGSVKAYLDEAKGLRHPMTAKIKKE